MVVIFQIVAEEHFDLRVVQYLMTGGYLAIEVHCTTIQKVTLSKK